MIKLCKTCGIEFETGKGNKRYCSDSCWRTERRIQQMQEFLRNREHHLKCMSDYAKNNPEKFYENTKKMREKYPEKYKARLEVEKAKKKGDIVYPDHCPICGIKKKVQAHHKNYLKPLDVEFMCDPCHKKEHKNMN